MDRQAGKSLKGFRWAWLAWAVLAVSTGGTALADSCAKGWTLPHEPLHALMLGGSSSAALLSALFIMLLRQSVGANPRHVWLAAALAGMGMLNGFHAGGVPESASIWMDSLTGLTGGLMMALLAAVPVRISAQPSLLGLPCLTAASSCAVGAVCVFFPSLLPSSGSHGWPALWAATCSLVGGCGFLAAGMHFSRKIPKKGKGQILLSVSCVLLAASACQQPFFSRWGSGWWLRHGLHLAASLLFLLFFLDLCRRSMKILRKRGDELESVQHQLSTLIEHSPSAVTLKDLSGRFMLVNRRFEEIFGVKKKDILGKSLAEILPRMTRRRTRTETDLETEYEESIPLEDGTRTFLTTCFPLADTLEDAHCIGCIQTDVTDRKRLEHRLQLDEKIIANTEEAIIVTDAEALIVDVNDAYTMITGYERDEVVGQNPRIAQSGRHDRAFYESMWRQLAESGSWSGEIWDRRKNGEVFEKWLTINAIRDSSNVTVNYVGIFTDITEKKNIERKLKNLLFYDPLTKLPNRTLFQERLEQAILNSQSRDLPLALFCIDLDRFKDINDSLGHKAGDELLIQAAKRIRSGVRKTDVVARLCGDEFTVILSEIKFRESVSHLARRLIHLLQQPFYIDGQEVFINASIGISMYPEDGREPEILIKHADTAMHFAKEREHGNFQHFRVQMNEKLVQRLTLERMLRHALDNSEFLLYYQPKYSLPEERIVGMEALIRWQHPEDGIISPGEFIPIAEESSIITSLGEWGLRTACRQVKDWEAQGLGLYRVAVNLSSRQFQNGELLKIIQDTLNETGLDPAFLELEITESTVMERPDQAVVLLRAIRQLGVRIAIDDFGTGYSSLAYLKRFPVNTIKIDQTFVADLTRDSDDAAIVESIIYMADSLNLEVVAEGIETQEQLDFFKERKCKEVQGYYFSKPLPAKEFAEKILGRTVS